MTVGLVAAGAETELRAVETLALALGGSTAIGLAVGLGGGWLVRESARRGLGGARYQGIALVALAALAFSMADNVEGRPSQLGIR